MKKFPIEFLNIAKEIVKEAGKKITTITEMNINDFGIFIFSMITPFNRKIVLYIT